MASKKDRTGRRNAECKCGIGVNKMPKGDKGKHTDKQKRKAEHISE